MKFEYFTDDSERSLAPFFSPLAALALVGSVAILAALFLPFWPWQPLQTFLHEQKIPLSFSSIFIAALIIGASVSLRSGRGELSRNHYPRPRHQEPGTFETERDFLHYGLIECLLHTLVFLFACLPLFIMAAALSVIPGVIVLKALSVLFTTSLLCRLFGFLTYLLTGRSSVTGTIFSRFFLGGFLVMTTIYTPDFSPLRLLYEMNIRRQSLDFSPGNPYFLYIVTVISAILFLIALNDLLVRHRIKKTSRERGYFHDR